jgi:hypothetical protein
MKKNEVDNYLEKANSKCLFEDNIPDTYFGFRGMMYVYFSANKGHAVT